MIKNQLRKFRIPFLIFIIFWIFEIVILLIIEPNPTFLNVFLISISVRVSEQNPDLAGFFQLLWPLMFELLVLSFILNALLEYYSIDPINRARRRASKLKNHSVILGYNHLGERIVDYLYKHKKPYSVVEIDQSKVEDLISLNDAVVVGDYTDIDFLRMAGVTECKEVFCVTRDLRRALITAENVRTLNKYCCLYMRVFDEHFRELLTSDPWNAYTFSTSAWTMDSVKDWSKGVKGEVILLGYDNIVKRIIQYYATQLKKEVYVIDPQINSELYSYWQNVKVFKDESLYIETLEEKCDLTDINQIYICWNDESKFSDSILLTIALKKRYPDIEVFVRMFDEELAQIAENAGAITFSTSAYAFKKLQEEVIWTSAIYPTKKKQKIKRSRKKSNQY